MAVELGWSTGRLTGPCHSARRVQGRAGRVVAGPPPPLWRHQSLGCLAQALSVLWSFCSGHKRSRHAGVLHTMAAAAGGCAPSISGLRLRSQDCGNLDVAPFLRKRRPHRRRERVAWGFLLVLSNVEATQRERTLRGRASSTDPTGRFRCRCSEQLRWDDGPHVPLSTTPSRSARG